MADVQPNFAERTDKKMIEEGSAFAPKFDKDGLIPAVVTDHQTGELLMQAFMNAESLKMTIKLGEAVYWSRSRQEIWHKGATSGHTQTVIELRTDCDQDCIWLRVKQAGSACHVGYNSCFYRAYPVGEEWSEGAELTVTEANKSFDPDTVYKKS